MYIAVDKKQKESNDQRKFDVFSFGRKYKEIISMILILGLEINPFVLDYYCQKKITNWKEKKIENEFLKIDRHLSNELIEKLEKIKEQHSVIQIVFNFGHEKSYSIQGYIGQNEGFQSKGYHIRNVQTNQVGVIEKNILKENNMIYNLGSWSKGDEVLLELYDLLQRSNLCK